jgi:heme exporter protein A
VPAIEFHDLHRRFGRLRVLSGVSGGAGAGEVLLVTGANGSGKSTLLRCLAGLLAPDRGEVRMTVGDRALEPAERRRAVGYLAPDLAFYEPLTTAENLAFFARLRGVDPGRGGALLDRVGLPHDREAGALSSGMVQRLRWAWALLHEPDVLLLDEPLANLDPPGRRLVGELLAEQLGRGAAAVVANPAPIDLPGSVRRVELAG